MAFKMKGFSPFTKRQDNKRTMKSDMKDKDTREIPEPSVEEQLELRNNNQNLRDQCAAKVGYYWDTATGTCKPEPKK